MVTVVLAATIVAVEVAAVADEPAAVDSNSVDGAIAADYADSAVYVVAHESVILADFETVTDFVNAVGDPVPINTDVAVVNFVAVATFVVVVAAVVTDFVGHVTETVVAHVTVSLPVNVVQIVNLEGAGVRIVAPGSLTVVAEAAVHHSVAYDALVVVVVVVKVGPHSAVVANGGPCTQFVAMTVVKSDGFVVAVVETVLVEYSVVPLDAVVLFVESAAAAVWQAGLESPVLSGSNSPLKPKQYM